MQKKSKYKNDRSEYKKYKIDKNPKIISIFIEKDLYSFTCLFFNLLISIS